MRRAFLIAGLATLLAAWLGPLPRLAQTSFSAHMIMHMGVVAVACPLLALGLRQTRLDPVLFAPALFAPIVASMLELIVVCAWHAPVLQPPGNTPSFSRRCDARQREDRDDQRVTAFAHQSERIHPPVGRDEQRRADDKEQGGDSVLPHQFAERNQTERPQ